MVAGALGLRLVEASTLNEVQTCTIHDVGTTRVLLADPAMTQAYACIRKLASSRISVLIIGETGSGKECAAEAVHRWSPRATGPWISVNCATLQESLAESELFGHERGAFTDARSSKPGLIERADGGTLFLDELGELAPPVQAKLLRVLESQRVTRLGDTRERNVDIRIVAATNTDLFELTRNARTFRQDLLYRLAAATIRIPALRDRPVEVEILARSFLRGECERMCRTVDISDEVLSFLKRYPFPGNVRELKNAIAYAAAIAEGSQIQLRDLPSSMFHRTSATAQRSTFRPIAEELRELEKQRILEALDAFNGVQTRAADALSMPLRTFTFRMRQYGITRR